MGQWRSVVGVGAMTLLGCGPGDSPLADPPPTPSAAFMPAPTMTLTVASDLWTDEPGTFRVNGAPAGSRITLVRADEVTPGPCIGSLSVCLHVGPTVTRVGSATANASGRAIIPMRPSPSLVPGDYAFQAVADVPGNLSDAIVALVDEHVPGCTDPSAFNFDAAATTDDGSCRRQLLDARDWSFTLWPVNFRPGWFASWSSVRHMETGFYALALDVTTGDLPHLGVVNAPAPLGDAIHAPNTDVTDLASATVRYYADSAGASHDVTLFESSTGDTSNPSELWDQGRIAQHIKVPSLEYTDPTLTGAFAFTSMPRHFVLTHRVANDGAADRDLDAVIELGGDVFSNAALPATEWLEGDRAVRVHDGAGNGWTLILPQTAGITPQIVREADGSLTARAIGGAVVPGDSVSLSVIVVPTSAAGDDELAVWLYPDAAVAVDFAVADRHGTELESRVAATFDPERGAYVVSLREVDEADAPSIWATWSDPDYHTWYGRHRVVLRNLTEGDLPLPLALDGGGFVAWGITGGAPLWRDLEGQPLGIPLQVSKNWHDGTWEEYWYHLYSAMVLPPGEQELDLTFVGSSWGEAYAASHAQLSLVGWGTNQQWEESALGSWGESITYDPDFTLQRAAVDDVRPFLVDTAGEWGWTGNVGGAGVFVYFDDAGTWRRVSRNRTLPIYTGPNLTKVVYAGVSDDDAVQGTFTASLGRTDDLVRAYYHFDVEVLADVTYDRFAIFQIAADNYADNDFRGYAYGNESGPLFDAATPDHGTTGYASDADRGISLPGEAPWVMLYANASDSDSLPENLGNVGFVIRDYEADIGGVLTTTPTINIQRTNNGFSQMAFELGIPYDPASPVIPAGSTIRATVEYLVPPSDKSAYYGASDHLLALADVSYAGPDMMVHLATGNTLQVIADVGVVERTYPIEITAAEGAVAAELTVTGGLGYTPLTFHGLPVHGGWQLEQEVGGAWVPVDQGVHGNDYWQAYADADAGTWDLTFNIHNVGTTTYRLVHLDPCGAGLDPDADLDGASLCSDADCDDTDPSVFPGAVEACNGIDDNCNGGLDEGLPRSPFFPDGDSDGFGVTDDRVAACAPPPGHVPFGGDCDDVDAAVRPGATEVCDGVDNNCDGTTDEGC